MFFDLRFLTLELEAARTGDIPPALFTSPAFEALASHEAVLDRPPLDAKRFRAYFAAAAAGSEDDWGLTSLFQQRGRLEEAMAWLEAEQASITRSVLTHLRQFTSAPLNPNLRCVLYVGTRDGGFKLGSDSSTVYLNLPAISCREGFLETLAHESYHARERSPQVGQLVRAIEDNDDYLGGVMYSTFEEGIADFIGNNGSTSSRHPVIRLRTPAEGTKELLDLLWRYQRGELSAEALYVAFRKTDCCYTAGAFIASCVWKKFGMEGLDIWSVRRDWMDYYRAFRSTPQGADWPELCTQ